jgi:hypothetical protein
MISLMVIFFQLTLKPVLQFSNMTVLPFHKVGRHDPQSKLRRSKISAISLDDSAEAGEQFRIKKKYC